MLQVRRMLLEHFGYDVLPTHSIEDAKDMVRRRCPDMLLMDNNDSGVEFEELAEHIKEMCPEVITVLLSPYYYASRNGSSHSIDRVIAKDEGPDGLISQIEQLFGEQGEPTQSASKPI